MDCRTALEILEVRQPARPDQGEPELTDAAAHLIDCQDCAQTLETRQRFDRRVTRVMRDVPVPSGLAERLLQTLQEHSAAAPADEPATVEELPAGRPAARPRTTRRQWLQRLSLTAAAALVATLGWFSWPQAAPETIALRDVNELLPAAIDSLPYFEGDFTIPRPGYGWKSDRMQFLSARGVSLVPAGAHELAVVPFVSGRRTRQEITGFLLIMPKARIADPPSETFMNTHEAPYRPSLGSYASTAWTEGDFVYVCYVKGGRRQLEALQNVLDSSPLG